ncbi:MAG TPA: lysophospholipid acyltransferase family protein [Fimbriimonadales bacterium]|nr:lysophospholipid acyltransferase family protein [Fimbriimonadales bacterium]
MSLGEWWSRNQPRLYGVLIHWLARIIGLTMRIRVIGEEKLKEYAGGKIIAGWHGRTFLAAIYFRNRGYYTLISHSRDGEMQYGIFRRFGFKTVRGSTGRGGARAAVECAKLLRENNTFVWTPDGPRGPSQRVQRGILWLAQKGNALIFPAASSARPRKILSSWDSYMIPYPFSKGIIIIGNPISVSDHLGEEGLSELAEKLESELNDLQKQAETALGYS